MRATLRPRRRTARCRSRCSRQCRRLRPSRFVHRTRSSCPHCAQSEEPHLDRGEVPLEKECAHHTTDLAGGSELFLRLPSRKATTTRSPVTRSLCCTRSSAGTNIAGCDRRTRCRPARPRPELRSVEPRRRIGSLLAACTGGSTRRWSLRQSVWGALTSTLSSDRLPRLDRSDLVADRDQRITESIDLGQRFALGRFDHQRSGDRPRHRRCVEAVVDQPFGDVLGVGDLLVVADVDDALVGDSSVAPRYRTGKCGSSRAAM